MTSDRTQMNMKKKSDICTLIKEKIIRATICTNYYVEQDINEESIMYNLKPMKTRYVNFVLL